jgi:hypothetical protein
MTAARMLAPLGLGVLAVMVPAQGQETYDFMPKGGRVLLLEAIGEPVDAGTMREIVTQKRSVDEWRAIFAEHSGMEGSNELETLVNYLAVNTPVAAEALDKAQAESDIAAALPPDGRDLAWENCQFCHSLFTAYLTIDRDVQGWRSTFETPFHREMRLTETERETFSRYSAINMPMRYQDVPEDLRF